MAISWTLYMLGLHPEIQERVREEVDQIFDNAALKTDNNNGEANESAEIERVTVTSDMMREMKYLDCVLKEVQRVYPTAPFVGRELIDDIEIAGYTVPKGTTCGILTFLLHRNAEVIDRSYYRPIKRD